jgi:tetratricopeptide (TPR) repeat protein
VAEIVSDQPAQFDVFLCYVWEDKTPADALRAALERAGLRVFQDDHGMRDYDYIPARIDAALRACLVLVALYTPAFPPSEYCRQELHFALFRSHYLNRRRTRVMAVVRDVDFAEVRPSRLKMWRLPARSQLLDVTAREIAGKVDDLRRKDPRRLGETPDPPPPKYFPQPLHQGGELHGRELELWRIHDALVPDDDLDAGGQVVAITGPGGQGKTMLAEHYARLFAADFPGGVYVFRGFGSHLSSGGAPAAARALQGRQVMDTAARVCGHVGSGADTALSRHLEQQQPYLWIVDDVPRGLDRTTFDSLIAPTGNGRTLITALHDLGGYLRPDNHVRLEALDVGAALAVLTNSWPAGSTEPSAARLERLHDDRREYQAGRDLVDDLGRHPLALALAAGQAGQADFGSFAELRSQLNEHDRNVLKLASDLQLNLPTDHQASIAATLLRSIEKVDGLGRDLLRVAGLVAPTPIPEPLFRRTLAIAGGLPEDAAGERTRAGLAGIGSRYLAQQATEETPLSWAVHALVIRAARLTDPDARRREQLRSAAVAALTEQLGGSRGGPSPVHMVDYVPHAAAIAAAMQNIDEWHLINEAGRLHSELGDSRSALELYTALYETCRRQLGDTHPTSVVALVGLGVAHGLHGDHAAARDLKERAFTALRDQLGPEHPDTLTAWNNLAVTYGDLGDHEAARDIYAAIHRVRSRAGKHTPEAVEALMHYSIAVGRCGQHELALPIKQEAYELCLAVHGEHHPRTLDALTNLAASTHATGDREAAYQILDRVGTSSRELLGRRPDTARALENLAGVSVDSGEITNLLAEAYQIRVTVQGPQHPQAQQTLRRLLHALLTLDDTGAALAAPTADPVEVLPADLHLGDIWLDDDQMDERIDTLELACRFYDGQLDAHGPDATDTMTAVCLLAHAHAALGQFAQQADDAWTLIDDAAEGLSVMLGPAHPMAAAADRIRLWVAGLGADA